MQAENNVYSFGTAIHVLNLNVTRKRPAKLKGQTVTQENLIFKYVSTCNVTTSDLNVIATNNLPSRCSNVKISHSVLVQAFHCLNIDTLLRSNDNRVQRIENRKMFLRDQIISIVFAAMLFKEDALQWHTNV